MNGAAILTQGLAAIVPAIKSSPGFPSLCTFQQPSGNSGPSGAPDGTWANVPGLADHFTGLSAIACTAPPLSPGSIIADEVRSLAEVLSSEIKHVLLNGRYAAVEGGASEGWRAVIDGTAYTVMGAESDAYDTMTRVRVRLVQVG